MQHILIGFLNQKQESPHRHIKRNMPISTTNKPICALTSVDKEVTFGENNIMKNLLVIAIVFLSTSTLEAQVWKPVNSGTQLNLNSVSFGSDLVGYIGADDSTLLKTIDGGLTWNIQPTQGMQFSAVLSDITQVDFMDENIGFAMVGDAQFYGYMFKTVDGGLNWTPEQVMMCSPYFSYNFDADNSYVVGASCFGGKTIDKKVNGVWQTNTRYLSWGVEYLRTMTFYDTLYGITAGDSGQVHRTFDGGASWDTVSTFTNEIIWDLQFVNDSTIYGVVDSLQNTLMISTDSGSTWQEHISSLTFFFPKLKSIAPLKNENIVTVGASSQLHFGVILWGNNDGTIWNVESVSQRLNSVTAVNDSIAFTVGDSGLILSNSGLVSSVLDPISQQKINVFPNPAQQQFSVSIKQGSINRVLVFDLMGRKALEVSGAYSQINIESLSAGLYHVMILTNSGKQVLPLVIR